MDDYFNLIKELILKYAYFAIFFALILENTVLFGFIVPGILVLLIAGFLAGTGDLNLFICILTGYMGTLVGDNLSYFFGRFGTDKFLFIRKIVERNKNLQDKLHNQKTYFLVFFQFPVYLRVVMPLILGFIKYPFQKWLTIDLIGSLLFNTTFIYIGYVIAKTTGLFADASNLGNWIQLFFFIVFSLWLIRLGLSLYKSRKGK